MLELQNFLRQNDKNGFDNATSLLLDTYGIISSKHSCYDNLVLFKYNQLISDMSQKIVQESRGIILDIKDNYNVVCFPYNKFFNIHEPNASNVDWSTAKIYDKLDGSIIKMYYYDNSWHFATNGTPDANCFVGSYKILFKDLVCSVFNELNYSFPDESDQDKTFIFELMTPLNRIVVAHDKNKLVLHGVRNNKNGIEYLPELYALKYNYDCVPVYDFSNQEEVMKAVEVMDGLKSEGYVVVDSNFNRVKIKCESYLRYSNLISALSTNNMLDIIIRNETAEFLSYFPEYNKYFEVIKEKYDSFVEFVYSEYDKYKHIKEQDEFANTIISLDYSFLLFGLRSGKFKTVQDGLARLKTQKVSKLIKVDDIEFQTI